MIRKGVTATIAAWAALAGMGAQAQTVAKASAGPCLSPAQAEGLVTVMLPGALRGLHTACDPKLPASAYLRANATALSQRYEAAARDAAPVAGEAIGRMAGLHTGLPTAAIAGVVGPMIEALVADSKSKLTPATCVKVSRALEMLDPLPMRNLTGLVEMVMEVGLSAETKKGAKETPFTICETPN